MTGEWDHDHVQELLGAYALGAVDAQERAIIEAHLATCGLCRAELDDHSQVAETLRRHATRVSPLASVEANGRAEATTKAARPGIGGRWRFQLVMAVVLVLFGALLAQAQLRFDNLEARMGNLDLLGRAQLASTDPGVRRAILRTPSNNAVMTLVVRADGGESYVVSGALPRLGKDRTYQLWRGDDRNVTPAVDLGRDPATVAFNVPSTVTKFLLTVEMRPVPTRPTLPAVATGLLLQRPAEPGA